MRKKLIIILICIIIPILLISALAIFDKADDEANSQIIEYDFDFYPQNYHENILEDEEYLNLNHIISYKSGAVTISVLPDEYSAIDPVIKFLAELINVMKNGDYEAYPDFFSENYKNKNSLPEKFTMQRIYNITIEKISEGRGDDGETQLIYMLDFMISKNNGSLRNDIDSDSSKPWYLTITADDGKYLIDNILTLNQK